MARPEELRSEEQRVAYMGFIFQKIEGFLGSEFTPAQYSNGGEQQVRFIKEGKVATLFVCPHLEKEMKADIALSVQGRGGKVFISQIPGAFIYEEKDGITFSEKARIEDRNGNGQSLSFKENGEIVPSL